MKLVKEEYKPVASLVYKMNSQQRQLLKQFQNAFARLDPQSAQLAEIVEQVILVQRIYEVSDGSPSPSATTGKSAGIQKTRHMVTSHILKKRSLRVPKGDISTIPTTTTNNTSTSISSTNNNTSNRATRTI